MSALAKQRPVDDDLSVQVANLAEAVRGLTIRLEQQADASVRLLKPDELAERWGYAKSKIYDLIAKRVLPTVRIDDGTIRIPLVAAQAVIVRALECSPDLDPEMIARLLKGEE